MKNNEARAGLGIWVLVAIVWLLYTAISIIEGGFIGYVKVIFLMCPIIAIILLQCRQHWITLLVITLSLTSVRFTFPLINAFNVPFLFCAILFVIEMFSTPLRNRMAGRKSRFPALDKWMLLFAVWMSVRFAMDPPGMATTGAEVGGASIAVFYVLGPWMYFVIKPVVRDVVFRRSHLLYVLFASLLGTLYIVHIANKMGIFRWFHELGDTPTWMMCATLIAYTLTADDKRKWMRFYGLMAVFLFLGVISRHRTRLLFILAEIFSLAYYAKALKRTVVALLLMGVLGIPLLFVIGGGELPDISKRALSLFIHSENDIGIQGERGWNDSFRAYMYEDAWYRIKDRPLLGRGMGFSLEDAIAALAVRNEFTAHELLASTGSYHNCILAIAVNTGVLPALIYSIATLFVARRYARYVKRVTNKDIRAWGMALMAYWFANTAMMLINGAQFEFLNSMILNGIMVGMMTYHDTPSKASSLLPEGGEESANKALAENNDASKV